MSKGPLGLLTMIPNGLVRAWTRRRRRRGGHLDLTADPGRLTPVIERFLGLS
jgi:hypothetical protein